MTESESVVFGKIEKQVVQDTLKLTFHQSDVWVGCKFIGNIEVKGNTVELQYSTACHPKQTVFITEAADLKFEYVLKNDKRLKGKEFVIKETNLIKE